MKKLLINLGCICLIVFIAASCKSLDNSETSESSLQLETTQQNDISDEIQNNIAETEPNFVETDAISITPIGKEIHNNGGTVVQYRDCIYYLEPNEYTAKSEYVNWSVGVMKEDGSEKLTLLDGVLQKKAIYAASGYIILGIDDKIIRISVENDEIAELGKGRLEYVDQSNNIIIFSIANYHREDIESGLYVMDINGEDLVRLCPEGYKFLAMDNDLVYLDSPHAEDSNDAVLSSVKIDGTGFKIVSAIPADIEGGVTAYENIFEFGICDDWIILAVGSYQGTGHFFYGGLVRLREDGSEIEHFYPSDIDSFEIYDNWIYFNDL